MKNKSIKSDEDIRNLFKRMKRNSDKKIGIRLSANELFLLSLTDYATAWNDIENIRLTINDKL